MKHLLRFATLVIVLLCCGFTAKSQSEFPFREKREHNNIISLHGTVSNYLDGGPFQSELVWIGLASRGILPNGIDYFRMLDEKNGFVISAIQVMGFSGLGDFDLPGIDAVYRYRRGGILSADYLRNLWNHKYIDIYGSLGVSFMEMRERIVYWTPGVGENVEYSFLVRDFGLKGGVRAHLALPLNFRFIGAIYYTEYLGLFPENEERLEEQARFTKRRVNLQFGLGYSFYTRNGIN
jgi:hypothetical protein